MRNLAADSSVVIRPADKGSCAVVQDHEDYLAEGYKPLNDNSIYAEVKNYKEKLLIDLTGKINQIFKRLWYKIVIIENGAEKFHIQF